MLIEKEQEISINTLLDPRIAEDINACCTCVLRKSCIFSLINTSVESNCNKLTTHSTMLKHNQHLYFSGDKLEAVYIVKSGSFKSYLVNHKGDEQIIDFQLPGHILGLDALPLHQCQSSVVALETSSVCAVHVSKFEQMIDLLVPDWLVDLMFGKLAHQQRNLSALGKKNAKRRIAAFIVELSENYQELGYSGKEFKLNMSRQDIGNYLGLASETISRIFTRMQNEGLLKLDRKDIRIVDFDNLNQLADKECFRN